MLCDGPWPASGADGGGRQAGLRGSCVLGFFAVDLLAGLADVDPTFKERAFLDADALGDDVSVERAFTADVEAIAGCHVAANFSENDDFTRGDVGGDYAVATDGDAIAGQIDGAFDAAVDVKRFGAGDFALDDQRLAERGLLLRGCDRTGSGARHRSEE